MNHDNYDYMWHLLRSTLEHKLERIKNELEEPISSEEWWIRFCEGEQSALNDIVIVMENLSSEDYWKDREEYVMKDPEELIQFTADFLKKNGREDLAKRYLDEEKRFSSSNDEEVCLDFSYKDRESEVSPSKIDWSTIPEIEDNGCFDFIYDWKEKETV
jgi:hypothetical protein